MAFVFFIAVAMLACIAVAAVVPSLLKSNVDEIADRKRRNVEIARQRLDDVAEREQAGELSTEDAEQIREDIQRELLQDLDDEDNLNDQQTTEPAGKKGQWAAVIVSIAIPFSAGGLYLALGEPSVIVSNQTTSQGEAVQQAQNSQNSGQMPSVDEMIAQLQTRLEQNPDDVQGWVTLGQSLAAQARFAEAVDAFKRARELLGDNADLLVREADSLAMSRGGILEGEPETLIMKALELNPGHPGALWLAGMAADVRGDFQVAIDYWKRARQVIDNPESLAELDRLVARAEGLVGTVVADSGVSLQVSVSIEPSLAEGLNPEDALYVLARAVNGPPMPLAVVKKQVRDLPLSVELNDSLAMIPDMKLSNFDEVIVVARVSRSGQALEQSGDVFGQTDTVRPKHDKNVSITIAEIVP